MQPQTPNVSTLDIRKTSFLLDAYLSRARRPTSEASFWGSLSQGSQFVGFKLAPLDPWKPSNDLATASIWEFRTIILAESLREPSQSVCGPHIFRAPKRRPFLENASLVDTENFSAESAGGSGVIPG